MRQTKAQKNMCVFLAVLFVCSRVVSDKQIHTSKRHTHTPTHNSASVVLRSRCSSMQIDVDVHSGSALDGFVDMNMLCLKSLNGFYVRRAVRKRDGWRMFCITWIIW